MPKRTFDEALLKSILERDNATLIGEYIIETTCHTVIDFYCKCGVRHRKKFYSLVNWNGALCVKCSNVVKQDKTVDTNIIRWGVERPSQNKIVHDKMTATNIANTGFANPFQDPGVKEKIRQRLIETIGVDHPSKSETIKERKFITNMNTRGVGNPSQDPEVQNKKEDTCLKTNGVRHPMQSVEVQEKSKETSRKNWGTDYPNQSQEFQIKNQNKAYNRKEFVMPSGEIRKHQGYEHFGLRDLLAQGYTEKQIKSNREDIPRIPYDCKGKMKAYFPDMFLPHENKIIEVKSTRTYDIDLEKKLKYQKKAVEEQGYVFEIWIYDKKGRRVEITNV
jgi:hypothetical protein